MIAPAAQAPSTAVPPAPPAAGKTSAATTVRDALAVADKVLGVASKAADAVVAATGGSKKKKSSAAGYAKPAGSASSSSAKKTSSSKTASAKKASPQPGPLAFLDDPRLSIEDKLIRLLSYLNDRWEKEMKQKMDEIAGKGAPGTAASGTKPKKKKGGILGAVAEVAGVAKKFFPQVGIAVDALRNPAVRAVVQKIGGPVLAAAASALGFPALAPVLLRFGPQVVDVAAGVASAFADQAAESQAAQGSATGASDAGGGALSDRQMQMKLMEVQRVMDQQKEMFSLVSNMLRSGHDARMAVIQNVR